MSEERGSPFDGALQKLFKEADQSPGGAEGTDEAAEKKLHELHESQKIDGLDKVLASARGEAAGIVVRRSLAERDWSVKIVDGRVCLLRPLEAGSLVDVGLSSGPFLVKEGDLGVFELGRSQDQEPRSVLKPDSAVMRDLTTEEKLDLILASEAVRSSFES